jgi:uncharacterized protein
VSEATQRFLPGLHAIEAFGRGGFRFGGMSHQGSIICLPSGVRAWHPPCPFRHDAAAYAAALSQAAEIDMLLIGCGGFPLPLPPDMRVILADAGLRADTMTTAAACGTFNVLLAEGRRVAAALVAVL